MYVKVHNFQKFLIEEKKLQIAPHGAAKISKFIISSFSEYNLGRTDRLLHRTDRSLHKCWTIQINKEERNEIGWNEQAILRFFLPLWKTKKLCQHNSFWFANKNHRYVKKKLKSFY